MKKINPEKVELTFDAKCPKCGSINGLQHIRTNVVDILYSGIPICSDCGGDLCFLEAYLIKDTLS